MFYWNSGRFNVSKTRMGNVVRRAWCRDGVGTYFEPSSMSRSTVLMGATTINGILCFAARTAALYVPIW